MRYVSLPSAPPVCVLGIGMLGATPANAAQAFDLLDAFFAAGGTLVDTAHVYGDGDADRTLGLWLARRDRAGIVILAKGGHPQADGLPRVSPRHLRSDLLESLDRMGTSYVDLFVLHRDDPSVPVQEILETLQGFATPGSPGPSVCRTGRWRG